MTNIRSLIGKLDELIMTVLSIDPDIVFLTETWLTESIASSSVNIPGYMLLRNDRTARKGGGVAFYIKSTWAYSQYKPQIYFLNGDIEFVMIDLHRSRLLFLGLYIPPGLTHSSHVNLHQDIVQEIDVFLSKNPEHSLIVLGDFNNFKCSDLCDDLCLSAIVTAPTRGPNILDNICISQELSAVYSPDEVAYFAPIANSDHLTICASPLINSITIGCPNKRTRTIYDYRKSNLKSLAEKLSQIDWKHLMPMDKDVNVLTETFEKLLVHNVNCSIPSHEILMSDKDKYWLSPLTKSLIDQRWEAYRNRDWQRYKQLKNKVKSEILKSKQCYIEKLKRQKNNVWKIVEQITGKKNSKTWDNQISLYGDASVVVDTIAESLSKLYDVDDPFDN